METPSDARSAAFFRLFEYGASVDPVFPMSAAVDAYRALWDGPHAWTVGPFSVSVNRLDEFITWAGDDLENWPVAVALDFFDPEWVAATRAGVATAQMFGIRTGAKIRHYDTKLPMGAGIRHGVNIAMGATGEMPVYFEVELSEEHDVRTSMESLIAELDLAGPRLRVAALLNGDTPPLIEVLAEFIADAQQARIRTRLKGGPTQAITSSTGVGILNVIAAYAFGDDRAQIEQILRETNPDAFLLTNHSFGMGGLQVTREDLTHLRWTELTAIELSDPASTIAELVAAGHLPTV